MLALISSHKRRETSESSGRAGRRHFEEDVMRIVKLMALLVAIMGGSFAVAGGAFATPLGSGTLATLPAQTAAVTLVEKAQYYRRGVFPPRPLNFPPLFPPPP